MFDLITAGLAATNAASVINAIDNGMSVASALSLFGGALGAGAFVLTNGLKWMIKWAGKETLIKW